MKLPECLVVALPQVVCCLRDFNSFVFLSCFQHFSLYKACVHHMFLKHCKNINGVFIFTVVSLWRCFVGSLILIGGDPGIGKSTLLLQVRRCYL